MSTDAMAAHSFNAPPASEHFTEAAEGPSQESSTATGEDQGHQEFRAQQEEEQERETPPEMHLRPKDEELVRDVHQSVDHDQQRQSFFKKMSKVKEDGFSPSM